MHSDIPGEASTRNEKQVEGRRFTSGTRVRALASGHRKCPTYEAVDLYAGAAALRTTVNELFSSCIGWS